MKEEKTVGIVFVFDREKPLVIVAPERLLPMRLEIVGLPHIRADTREELADFVHGRGHKSRASLSRRNVRLVPWNVGISGWSASAADDERERVDDRGVHRRIASRRDRLRGGAGESLVEMQRDAPMLRSREQRVDKALALIVCKQRVRQPSGLISVPDPPGLFEVARPEDVVSRRVRAIVRQDQAGSLLERDRVPEKARR